MFEVRKKKNHAKRQRSDRFMHSFIHKTNTKYTEYLQGIKRWAGIEPRQCKIIFSSDSTNIC